MLGFIGIIAGIALVLAVIVSALIIGTCLVLAWVTDTVGGRSRRGRRGGGRSAGPNAPYGPDAPSGGNGGRYDPGAPVTSRQGYPRRDGSGVPAAPRRDYR
jgi:hypothetical protein